MQPEDSYVESVPRPVWGSPMQHHIASGVHVICAEAPGLFRSPPALRLFIAGIFLLAVGFFIISGAAIGSFREFEVGSVFAFLIGGGVGALIAWVGITVIRWAAAAAWSVTEITITSSTLRVRRTRPVRWQAEVARADFFSAIVTDQLGLADELLVTASGHRVMRVLSGRSVVELRWLARLIESQLADESESDMAELDDRTHDQIKILCAQGDQHANNGEYPLALEQYWEAWNLLPQPKTDWGAATWILAALGDANFQRGDFEAARDNLSDVMRCPDAVGNPFVSFRQACMTAAEAVAIVGV